MFFGVAVAVIRRESVLAPAPPDETSVGLPPERPPRALGVERFTFGMALRGYLMTEVDDALDRRRDTLGAEPEIPPRQLSGRNN